MASNTLNDVLADEIRPRDNLETHLTRCRVIAPSVIAKQDKSEYFISKEITWAFSPFV